MDGEASSPTSASRLEASPSGRQSRWGFLFGPLAGSATAQPVASC